VVRWLYANSRLQWKTPVVGKGPLKYPSYQLEMSIEVVAVASVNSTSPARQSHSLGSQEGHCLSHTCRVVLQAKTCKMPFHWQASIHHMRPALSRQNALDLSNFQIMMQPWRPKRHVPKAKLSFVIMQGRLGMSKPAGLGLSSAILRRAACLMCMLDVNIKADTDPTERHARPHVASVFHRIQRFECCRAAAVASDTAAEAALLFTQQRSMTIC